MNVQQRNLICSLIVVGGLSWMAAVASHAQAPPRTSGSEQAEREKIWNSPNMLRARAWLQDYCSIRTASDGAPPSGQNPLEFQE